MCRVPPLIGTHIGPRPTLAVMIMIILILVMHVESSRLLSSNVSITEYLNILLCHTIIIVPIDKANNIN